MSSAKKSAKPSNTKKPVTHPSWAEMIKECIIAHPEEARSGVSRPQIKKFVEIKYKLQIGAAQTSQLNKAITSGAEKGIFVLPKGPSGKVKLPPKKTGESTATKENKPTTKPVVKPVAKPKPKTSVPKPKPASAKPSLKKAPAPKAAIKPVATKKTPMKSVTKKTAPIAAAKKPSSKKLPIKKSTTGGSASKAKSAASKSKGTTKKPMKTPKKVSTKA